MTVRPVDFGPRPFPTKDDEPTNPINAKPAPRKSTPIGGFLAPLGERHSDPFPSDEAPTPTRTTARVLGANKHMRVFVALAPEDAQLVHAFALRLLGGQGR